MEISDNGAFYGDDAPNQIIVDLGYGPGYGAGLKYGDKYGNNVKAGMFGSLKGHYDTYSNDIRLDVDYTIGLEGEIGGVYSIDYGVSGTKSIPKATLPKNYYSKMGIHYGRFSIDLIYKSRK
jgi:hypothetical protein